ncbi:MAG: hypothetical protein V1819_02900, partial [bacterium]
PAGSNTQTIRHNGTAWVANNALLSDGASATANGNFFVNNNLAVTGNVGIGSTNPTDKLQVSGALSVSANDTAYGLGYYARLSSGYSAQPLLLSSRYGAVLSAEAYGAETAIFANNAEVMRLKAGNVGIGTASPSANLHISSPASILRLQDNNSVGPASVNYIDFYDSTVRQGWIGYGSGVNSNMYFANDTGANWLFSGSGNVGIGTGGPDRRLDIFDTANPQLRLTYTDGTKYVDQQALSTGDWSVSSNLGKLLKTDSANYNTFLGQGAFNNLEGRYNVGLGYRAGFNNDYTTGSEGRYNTYIGYQAGYGGTSGNKNIGYGNSVIGPNALYFNTTGYNNSAMGQNALFANTTGYNNSALSAAALSSNTTGYNNSAMGVSALISNTTGAYNIAMGKNAGAYLAAGTVNQESNNSVFLGYDTRASVAGGTNEIVIGSSAIGAGSNTVVLGADSITKTLLKGKVGIGTADPGTNKLEVVGGPIKATGGLIIETRTSEVGFTPVDGQIWVCVDTIQGNGIPYDCQ